MGNETQGAVTPIDPNSIGGQMALGATSQPVIPPSVQQDVSQPPDISQQPTVGQQGQQQLPPREIGQAEAAQPPPDKKTFFRQMLGNFFYAAGTGLAASGHGPGANARGAGAALTALPNLDIQHQQIAMQQQQIASEAALREAQASQYQNTVMTPYGPMNSILAGKLFPALARGQAQENVQGQKSATAITQQGMKNEAGAAANTSKEAIASGQTGSKETIAANKLAEQRNEFYASQKFKEYKTNADNATKERVASMVQSKAPAAMMQNAVYASSGLSKLDDMESTMDQLEKSGTMGSLPKNWIEDWVFKKGAVDPSLPPATRNLIGQLRSASDLASSAMLRAHTGRTSKEIYDDFKNMLGPGQDWNALRGAMTESRSTLADYANAPTNANITKLRTQGGAPTGGGAQQQYSPDNPFAPKK